jgi:hypothetical protein
MITIFISLFIVNSHYLFYMNLNLSNATFESKSALVSNANFSKTCRHCSINDNFKNTINFNKIIRPTNISKFFVFKPQDEVFNKIKNRLNLNSPNSTKKSLTKIKYVCYPMYGTTYNYFLNHVWIYIDIWIYSLIPAFVMITCSILILIEINKKSKRYLSYLEKATSKDNQMKSEKRLRRNKQLLFM